MPPPIWFEKNPHPSQNISANLYFHLSQDYGDSALIEDFEICCNHIHAAIERKENILVHCEGGINRGPTITITYLISRANLTLRDAVYLMKKKREVTKPHMGYLKQLEKLEVRIRQESSISLEELVGLFEPIEMIASNPSAAISQQLWASVLDDYMSGKLQENIEKLSPAQKMVLLNIACKLQSIVVADTS